MKTTLTKFILNCHDDVLGRDYIFHEPMVFSSKKKAISHAILDRNAFLRSEKGKTFRKRYVLGNESDGKAGKDTFEKALAYDGSSLLVNDGDCRRVYSLAEVVIPVEIDFGEEFA